VSKLVERGALNVVRAGAQRSAIRIECIAARKSPRIRKKPGPAPPKSRFYETRPAGRWKPFTDADSRHNEDLLRIRILYSAPRRVTADVDVSAAGVEWIKNETGLAWNGSGHWKLRSARGLLRGRRRFRRRPVCRNLRRCMRRWSIRFARSGARCGCWRREGYRLAGVRHIGRGRSRGRLRFVKNVAHRCGDGAADLVRCFTTNQADCNQRDRPATPIHRGFIRRLFFSARHRQRTGRFLSPSSPTSTLADKHRAR